LLFDAVKKLDATSEGAVRLYRGQAMNLDALEYLRQRKGGVMASTCCTSFSDSERSAVEYMEKAAARPKTTKVLFELESSGRMKIGGFSALPGEEECLLPPGSAAQIVGV
jgi:hypothetical protein